jgi:hypothetical protein
MNERIKLLAEQAFAVCGKHSNNYNGPAFSAKFAQLIVAECADQIISKGTDWVDFAPSQTGVRPEYWNMAQQIKQHFGVEE